MGRASEALGWTAQDLFGLHDAPHDTRDIGGFGSQFEGILVHLLVREIIVSQPWWSFIEGRRIMKLIRNLPSGSVNTGNSTALIIRGA
jgi:hypothetical protein